MTGAVQAAAVIAAAGSPVFLANITATNTAIFPATASASIRFTPPGAAQREQGVGAGFVTQYFWLRPGFSANNFEIKYDGVFASGSPLGTWLPLSSIQTWTVTRSSLGTLNDSGAVSIRNASSLLVLATATLSFSATVSSS